MHNLVEANIKHQFLSVQELLDTVLKFDGKDIVLYDIESTGLSPKKDQITQIGAAILDGKTFKIKHKFNEKCKLTGRHLDTLFSKMSSDMLSRSKREKENVRGMGLLNILMMTGYFNLSKSEIKDFYKSTDRGDFLNKKYKESASELTEKECLEKFMNFLSKAKNPILIAHNSDFDSGFISIRLGRYAKTAIISDTVKKLIGFDEASIKDELSKVPPENRTSKRYRMIFQMLRNYTLDKSKDVGEQEELFNKLVNWKPIPEFVTYKNKWDSYEMFDSLDLVKYYFVPAIRALMRVPNKQVAMTARQLVNQMKNISKRNYKTKSVTTWNVSSSLGPTAKALGIESRGWHNAFDDVVMMFNVIQSIVKYLKDNLNDITSSEEFSDIKKSMKDLSDKNKRVDNTIASIEEPLAEDRIVGGLADNLTPEEIAKKHGVDIKVINKQIQMGVKVELEHTTNKQLATEIAMDHLYEDPKYYTKLQTIEPQHIQEGKLKKIFATGAMMVASLLAKADISPIQLFNQIKKHEGEKNKVYTDTQGHPTIGIGFNLDSKHNQEYLKKIGIEVDKLKNGAEIGEGVIKILYNHSLTQAWYDINDLVPNFKSLPTKAQMVLLDMSFNLGKSRLAGFKKMLSAVQRNDFKAAANEMKNSRWYYQVKSRGENLVNMMRNAND